MADEKEIRQAKAAYDTLCEMLKAREWHYESDEDNFTIMCGARGEDLPMEIRVQVDPERLIVTLLSQMPFSVPEDKRVEMALAVSAVNYALVDGSFDYNFVDGTLLFRMTSSYRESLVGKDMFEYMLYVSCKTIDDYNDKFLMIIKEKMTLEDLVKFIAED